jgi:hypothetical protein
LHAARPSDSIGGTAAHRRARRSRGRY